VTLALSLPSLKIITLNRYYKKVTVMVLQITRHFLT